MVVPRTADLGIPGVSMDGLGLRFSGAIPFADWEGIGQVLGTIRDMSAWAMADWVARGADMYGEEYGQGLAATRRSETTLLEYERVARQVPRSRRRPELTFTHHQVVAALDPAQQVEWLERAVADDWSVAMLRREIQDWRASRGALPTRRNRSAARVQVLELVESVARTLLRSVQPASCVGAGFAAVPVDVLERLANALGPDPEESGR